MHLVDLVVVVGGCSEPHTGWGSGPVLFSSGMLVMDTAPLIRQTGLIEGPGESEHTQQEVGKEGEGEGGAGGGHVSAPQNI